MKVLIKSLLCFLLLIQTVALAQDANSDVLNGISKISGIDIIVVEEALDSLAYDAELQELNLVSEHANLKLKNWSEEWLVALAGLLPSESSEIIQPLSLEAPSNIIMKSQGQFRMSGPFETIELYEQSSDSSELAEEAFLLFIGNDIPLKWNWLPEFEGKIEASGVQEGGLELTQNNQTYILTPKEITPLADNLCTYLMALNESQTSDILGNKASEWRFDVVLFKCAE